MTDKRTLLDREILERFVEHLRSEGYPDLKIDSWPEDGYPGQSVVEAIAGNLAIEHTSVDTLPESNRSRPVSVPGDVPNTILRH